MYRLARSNASSAPSRTGPHLTCPYDGNCMAEAVPDTVPRSILSRFASYDQCTARSAGIEMTVHERLNSVVTTLLIRNL